MIEFYTSSIKETGDGEPSSVSFWDIIKVFIDS